MYRIAVSSYRNATSKEHKREMEKLIATIKHDFESEVAQGDKRLVRLNKLKGEMVDLTTQTQLFDRSKTEKKAFNKKVADKAKQIKKLETEIEEIRTNKIYEHAFEWRFEFPEVLDDEGNFVGFDVVIGNPPYIKEYEGKEIFDGLRDMEVYQGKMDIWYLFGELAVKILKNKIGLLSFIAPNNWITNAGASKFRNFIIKNTQFIELINFASYMVFDTASIQTMIMSFRKNTNVDDYKFSLRGIINENPIMKDAQDMLNHIQTNTNE